MPFDASAEGSSASFSLLVIGRNHFGAHWLPAVGEVVIGSSSDCEIVVDDTEVAARHARLVVREDLTLTALAGAVQVGRVDLGRGDSITIGVGDSVTLGPVTLIVQKRTALPARRILTHGYFETRLEEECLRSERTKAPFALVQVRAPEVQSPVVEQRLSRALRILDLVGSYGAGVFHVLLIDTSIEGARLVLERIRKQLEGIDRVAIGLVHYGQDGRTAQDLLETAGHNAGVPRAVHVDGVEVLAPIMAQTRKLVAQVAATTINVLILGETGVGKERTAFDVHRLSPRSSKPFQALNAAALPETLLESELFGFERGAFTGAVQAKRGLLEAAQGGTVFLDEVGELPMSIQVKLLRVLETHEVLPVGALKPRTIDVRFVAATNRDLEGEVARGRFRADLYFRLNGMSIFIPPLRERISEIGPLARALVNEAADRFGRSRPPRISPEVMRLLEKYHWPGNIRELRNVIERAVVVSSGDVIDETHVPSEKLNTTFTQRQTDRRTETPPLGMRTRGESDNDRLIPPSPAVARTKSQLEEELRSIERTRIVAALTATSWNQTSAAKVLGVSRRTLVSWMKTHGISGPRVRRDGSA